MTSYFILYIAVAFWLYRDAKARLFNGLPWSIATMFLGPTVVPFYIAKRPLKQGEVREGGFGWNVLRNFALFWTLTIFVGFIGGLVNVSEHAQNATSEAEQIGVGMGVAIGGVMIFLLWLFVLVGALVFGLFLKKSAVVERGPTGALANLQA